MKTFVHINTPSHVVLSLFYFTQHNNTVHVVFFLLYRGLGAFLSPMQAAWNLCQVEKKKQKTKKGS